MKFTFGHKALDELLGSSQPLNNIGIEDVVDMLERMPPEAKAILDQILARVHSAWAPFPGPQTMAYYSEATFLYYGGAAGGGKSDLLLGTSLNYRRGAILRRVFPNMRALIERSRMLFRRNGTKIAGSPNYNENLHTWTFPDGRTTRFMGLQHEKNTKDFQGNPYDYYGFDEVTEFTEYIVRFVTTWLRPLDIRAHMKHGRKPRVICTGNPPTDAEGMWVLKFWAPWLDETHPNPAANGELRWFTTLDGKDQEVDGPDPFKHKGELIIPKSRTFIPALLSDNPALEGTGYRSQLQQLPEPLRSKMLNGDFAAGITDHAMQLIPTAWIKAAQKRWRETPEPKNDPIDSCGIDVARGGRDRTVITPKRGTYVCAQREFPGKMTTDGDKVAVLALQNSQETTVMKVDVIGVGSSAYDALKKVRKTVPMNASKATEERDLSRLLRFRNSRSLWYWRVREFLDPERGLNICLPDDPELLADLAAPRFEVKSGVIEVESKETIMERIKRSPDKGDSVVYALNEPAAGSAQGLFELYRQQYAEWAEAQAKAAREAANK